MRVGGAPAPTDARGVLQRSMLGIALLAPVPVGCADVGGDAGGAGPDGAAARPHDTATSGGGDDAAHDGGGGGAGGEAVAPTRRADVLIVRAIDPYVEGRLEAVLLAWFESEPPAPPGTTREHTCDELRAGACTYTRCTWDEPAPSGSIPLTFTSAGTLTVGGEAAPLTADPLADGSYNAWWTPDVALDPWPSGGTVTLAASGGEVPAFTASVQAPTRLVFDAATFPFDTIPRTDDLVLTWTALGGGDSTLWVNVVSSIDDANSEGIVCEVPVVDEMLVVPRELVARLTPATRADGDGPMVWLGTGEATSVTAGDWNVRVAVSDAATLLFVSIE